VEVLRAADGTQVAADAASQELQTYSLYAPHVLARLPANRAILTISSYLRAHVVRWQRKRPAQYVVC
jgi:hypothetical protein